VGCWPRSSHHLKSGDERSSRSGLEASSKEKTMEPTSWSVYQQAFGVTAHLSMF